MIEVHDESKNGLRGTSQTHTPSSARHMSKQRRSTLGDSPIVSSRTLSNRYAAPDEFARIPLQGLQDCSSSTLVKRLRKPHDFRRISK